MSHPTEQDREKAEELVERLREHDADGYDLNIDAAADAIAQAIADAREQENEACAKVCDDMSDWRDWAELKHENFPGAPCEAGAAADWLATAIRARPRRRK